MDVVATAGHVDHGKSTLVRALTGMEPDRWQQEHDRGLTIDLGFAWTRLPGGRTVAFVDVPGHERFVGNMLAGVGPVPAALFVVAADEGWSAQSTEHLAALDALGVRHGLLVLTKADLADPEPTRRQASEALARSTLRDLPSVAVSARTGVGLERLRTHLDAMVDSLPEPDRRSDVRLWVDRAFSVRGAGTVVTGTLAGGVVRVGDEFELATRDGFVRADPVRVRGLECLGRTERRAEAVARVALNLRGVPPDAVARGDVLLTPGRWWLTDLAEVRLLGTDPRQLPTQLVLHLGSAAVPVRVRALGDRWARLRLARPLPLRTTDRALLRDPGRHRIVAGVLVLDPDPPELAQRGAARRRADRLAAVRDPVTDVARLRLRDRPVVHADELRRLGLAVTGQRLPGGWCADEQVWASTVRRARAEYESWRAERPTAGGMPTEAIRRRLAVPSSRLAELAATEAGLVATDGLVRGAEERATLPPAVEAGVRELERELASAGFVAPTADRLGQLGLGRRELAAAERTGRLRVLADGVVLLPDTFCRATEVLRGLPQPFTASAARQVLGTSRRVVIPLLEKLAAAGVTERLPDGTHRVRECPPVRG